MKVQKRSGRMLAAAMGMLLVVTMLFSSLVPAFAYSTDGNYTGYFKLWINGRSENVLYVSVPCGGNTVEASYVWNPSKYCFELQVTEGEEYVPFVVNSTVNDADVSGVSWSYTSPGSGKGDFSSRTEYADALYTSDKTVQVNLVADSEVVGSVSTVLDASVFGRYLIKAADLEEEITDELTQLGYDPADFSFAQQAYTEFTYEGCSDVNFTVDGSKPGTGGGDTQNPGGDTQNPGSGEDDKKTCLLKIYGVEYGVTEDSPTYGHPYTEYIEPGYNYRILNPESYGIYPKEGYAFDYWYSTGEREPNTDIYIPAHSSGWTIVAYYKQIQVDGSVFTVQLVDETGDVIHTYTETYSGQYYAPVTIVPDADELPASYVYEEGQEYTGIVGRPETVQFRVEKRPTYTVTITKNTEFISAEGIGEEGTVVAGQAYTLPLSDSAVLTGTGGYWISKVYVKDQTSGKTVANTTGLWESVDLADLFTPEEGHTYAVSLLVELATYSVTITKNTEFISAEGIGEEGTVVAGQAYTLPVTDGIVLSGAGGYRISKVYIKDLTSGETIVDTTGLWESVNLADLFTPEGGHSYTVSLLVKEPSYSVTFSKNAEHVLAYGVGDNRHIQNNVEYTVNEKEGFLLVPERGYRFTKVLVKDAQTGEELFVVEPDDPDYIFDFAGAVTPERDRAYVIHFNVAADTYTVQFTKNSSLFTADEVDGSLSDNTSYSVPLWDGLTLRTKDSDQAFTKIYIKDVSTGEVALEEHNLGHVASLEALGFAPEKDHVYQISVLIG